MTTPNRLPERGIWRSVRCVATGVTGGDGYHEPRNDAVRTGNCFVGATSLLDPRGWMLMDRQLSGARRLSVLALIVILLLTILAGLSLAQTITASQTTTQVTPTPPILNQTETPTSTPQPGAEVLVVDDDLGLPTADCPNAKYDQVQAAVDDAEAGETVQVCAGTYPESVTVTTQELTIQADGDATIDGGPEDAVHITASQVTIQNFNLRSTNRSGVLVDTAERVVIQNNTVLDYRETDNPGHTSETRVPFNDGIRLYRANRSIIRDNNVSGFDDDQISIGEREAGTEDFQWAQPIENISTSNRIVNNTVTSLPGYGRCGIAAERKATKTVIENNIATDMQSPSSHPIVIERQLGYGTCNFGNQTKIMGNTIARNGIAVFDVGYGTEIIGNMISNHTVHSLGIYEGGARITGNEIRGSGFTGIQIALSSEDDVDQIEIHRNVIIDSREFGIRNANETMVVNATNNIWDCGGPSGGLEDPNTGRVANGTGDEITASDEPGVSNVHFDPFRELSSCSSQPKPTPTPTATATATATPTETPSPTATGTVSTADNGTGAGGVDTDSDSGGSGESTSDESGETDADTPTLTTTPTVTPTPTPKVEPGFGVISWIVSLAIIVCLSVVRRRATVDREEHDG